MNREILLRERNTNGSYIKEEMLIVSKLQNREKERGL